MGMVCTGRVRVTIFKPSPVVFPDYVLLAFPGGWAGIPAEELQDAEGRWLPEESFLEVVTAFVDRILPESDRANEEEEKI